MDSRTGARRYRNHHCAGAAGPGAGGTSGHENCSVPALQRGPERANRSDELRMLAVQARD